MNWINLDFLITFYSSPAVLGVLVELFFILIIAFCIRKFPNSHLMALFEVMYSKMYHFYSNILWKEEEKWVLNYVLALFCIIFFSNVIWVFLEFLSPFFWLDKEGSFFLEWYVTSPTSDINFNLAMALISIFVLLSSLKGTKGFGHLLNEFFPIFWKGYISVWETYRGKWYYYPVLAVAEALDTLFSLLIGILDLVWLGAKVVSLSFRLFGNIASGTILLAIVVGALSVFTKQIFGFSFPVVIPLFVYLLGILVSVVQAFVFTLLLSVSIKVSKLTS